MSTAPMSRTPGRWSTGGTSFYKDVPRKNIWGPTALGNQSGELVAQHISPANAAFIVLAVNSHDALTEALRLAYVELNEIHARDGVPYTSQGWKASVTQEHFTSVVETCRAALKLAEGGV